VNMPPKDNTPDTLDDLAKDEEDEHYSEETFKPRPESVQHEDVFAEEGDPPLRQDRQFRMNNIHEAVQQDEEEQSVEEDDRPIPNIRPQMPVSSVVPGFQRGNLHNRPPQEPETFQNPNTFASHQYGAGNRGNYPRKNKSSKLHLFILALVGLVTIGATVYVLKYRDTGIDFLQKASPSPAASAAPEPTATPVPTPTVDRSQYKVAVLNGTAKTGYAASISAKLKDLGYQTDKTGNATNSAFTQTQVRVKDSAKSILETVIADLAPDLSAVASTALPASDANDIQVIIGAK
jgi:hypothetical protein